MKFVEILFLFVLHCPSSSPFFIYKGTVCLVCDSYTLEFLKCKRRAKKITRFFKLRKIYSESEDVQWINRQHLSLHRSCEVLLQIWLSFITDKRSLWFFVLHSRKYLEFHPLKHLRVEYIKRIGVAKMSCWVGGKRVKNEWFFHWQPSTICEWFTLQRILSDGLVYVLCFQGECSSFVLPDMRITHMRKNCVFLYFWLVDEWNRSSQTSHRQAR